MLGHLDGSQTTFAPGEVVEFVIEITEHHMGHFEFGLCREQLSHATEELQCSSRVKVFRLSVYRSFGKRRLIMFGWFLVGTGPGPPSDRACSSQFF